MSLQATGGLVLTVLCLAMPAQGDQWSKTYPVSGQADLALKTGDGNVRIDAWDRPEIDARIETVGYTINKDFSLIESQAGGRVSIELKFPSGWNFNMGRHSVEVIVKVPRDTKLDVNTADGRVSVTGTRGEMRIHTGDGAIDGTNLDGRLIASTGDGPIRVAGRFDEIDLHTGDGTVEDAAMPGSTVASQWSVRTGDGGVTLRLPDGFKADLEADTGDGGVTLNVPVTVSGSVSRSHVRGALNGGGGLLKVHTGDGSIRVDRY